MTEFSRRLQRCREAAGYATPGEFYRSAGGRPILRCTLAQYRNIERGRCTPKAQVMHGLLTVLDLWKERRGSLLGFPGCGQRSGPMDPGAPFSGRGAARGFRRGRARGSRCSGACRAPGRRVVHQPLLQPPGDPEQVRGR
ncbi:MAG: helix-turn-helix domain-containing protein [Elusimicrobia bacterium]|nr:helix-turn-helix domain-containing protein [Elusimicrobiota bacterium]